MKKDETDKLATALQKRIGEKIAVLRKDMGYTNHEQFAYDHGFSRETYRRLEAGDANLTVRTLAKILLIHKLTIEQFFTSLPEEPRKPKRSPKE
jgi:transcriptional regulator with XRE-family HTH domain